MSKQSRMKRERRAVGTCRECDIGLSPTVGEIARVARHAERHAAAEILGEGRTPAKVLELAQNAHAFAELQRVTFGDAAPRPACRAGCAWCCSMHVTLSAPEAIALADHLRRTRPPAELVAVQARVADLDAATRGLGPQARFEARRPCALLEDRRCGAYAARPIACRAWNATDAAACERAALAPESAPTIVANELLLATVDAVGRGLMDGSADGGLRGEALELTAALRIALEMEDVAGRWASGEDVFAAARAVPNDVATERRLDLAAAAAMARADYTPLPMWTG